MPGVLEVDAILQLCGFFLSYAGYTGYGRALRTGRIVFREQVRPHHKLVTYKIDIKKHTGQPTPLAFGEGVAYVDGEVSAEVEGIMVGLFKDLSYPYP
jgi:3-hydroxyacyl-[acyl-carrier protein] dehydratase/trans-2-decenoyl-[acyl-carrier protein] isomerase